jgi:ABC-2 type transport system permease protein
VFKLWRLFVVQFKSSFQLFDGRQKVKPIHLVFAVLIAASLLPSFFTLGYAVQQALNLLIPIQQEALVLSLWLVGLTSLVFVLALFIVPAIFYFSKDNERLLVLPVSARTLLFSKFLLVYVYDAFTVLILSLPVLIPYVINVRPPLSFYLISGLFLITLSWVPLVMASLLVMVVMGLFPRFKNRDLFNLLSSFIILALAMAFSFAVNQPTTLDEAQLINALIAGGNSLSNVVSSFIPSVAFAIDALIHSKLWALAIYVIISLVALLVFSGVGEWLYFKGVIGVSETGAKRSRLNQHQWSKRTQHWPVVLTYALKELRLLVRTPIYLFNNVATALLMPLLLFPILYFQAGVSDPMIEFISSLNWNDPNLFSLVVLIGFSVGLAMSALNLITPTAISREGTNVTFMKYIPVDYLTQLWAKILSGLVVSLLGLSLMLVPVMVWFRWGLTLSLVTLLAGVLGLGVMNVAGMLIDVMRPKLIWENEAVPVKQNLNALFSMGLAFALGFGLFTLNARLDVGNWSLLILFGLMLGLNLLSIWLLQRYARRWLTQLEM